jgi:uncharacterized protein YndB with AHSA1/START domain
MARFDVGITIKRPVEDVFAVLSDFSNGSKWASGAVEPAKQTSAGPIGVGTTWHGVGKVAGRQFDTEITFTEFEPNRKITLTITKPFPTTWTVTLESVAGGTRVSQTVEAEPGGFFKLAEPLVVTMAKRQFQNDLDNLRDLMEANAL